MWNFTLLGCLELVDLWLETTKQQFHEIHGFLSLQLRLSFELGLRIRLTNTTLSFCPFLIRSLITRTETLNKIGVNSLVVRAPARHLA